MAGQLFSPNRRSLRKRAAQVVQRLPRRRYALLAVPVAVVNEMASWRDLEPDAFAAVVYVTMLVGLLALGALAGWIGFVSFVPIYLAVTMIEEAWVYEQPAYECDPFCSSPAIGLYLALPFLLIAIALGVGARAAVKSGSPHPPR